MKKFSIGFLFYASNKLGLGHLYRNKTLISNLKRDYDIYVFTNHYIESINQLSKFNINIIDIEINNIDLICDKIKKCNIDLLIVDILNNTVETMMKLKKNVPTIIDFDDSGFGAKYSDYLINAIVPLPSTNCLPEKVFVGPEYMIFNEELDRYFKMNIKQRTRVKKILVSFGGSDPNDITNFILPTLFKYKNIEFSIILGPGYRNARIVTEKYRNYENFKFYCDVKSLASYIYESDICIISGGLTLFETIFLRKPSLILCQVDHQVITSEIYEKYGACINMGLSTEIDLTKFNKKLNDLIQNNNERLVMSENCKNIINRNGLYSIIDMIEVIKGERNYEND